MALLDLLGRRWTLRVVWELRSPVETFRDLQARCDDISSSVLAARLAELRDAGVAERSPDGGYRLTEDGEDLLRALAPLDGWARRWARRRRAQRYRDP
jgi:DNA-binding HxlR family transcriptional regulator